MEALHWKIDGEFICNLARIWFWDENRPYEKSEELLISEMGTDEISLEEKKKIAQDIIEGKKKLVGINTFTLKEDNEKVRLITEKIEELKRKLLIDEIKNHIKLYAIRYVDPYSTVKSFQSAIENNITTYDEVYDYFCFNEFDYDKENNLLESHSKTKCGLWLLDHPEIVADYYGKTAPLENSDEAKEFWESIYNAIKDIEDDAFKERNKFYTTIMKIKEENRKRKQKYFDKQYQKIKQMYLEIDQKDPMNMTEDEYTSYLIEQNPGDINYRIIPDNYEEFDGLISPKGEFYSCQLGHHNIKAYNIILTKFKEFGYQTREEANKSVKIDKALDKLILYNWMATRYLPGIGAYLTYREDLNFKATDEQKDVIWKTIAKHNVYVNYVGVIL